MRENNLLSPHRWPWREIPMSVKSPMPPTSCGARTGCSRWTPGAGYSPPSAPPSASAGMCRRPSSDLHGACDCMPRPPGAARGRPCGWITAPSICRPLHQPDQVLGHPAVLRLRRTAPDQRRRREVQSPRSRNRSSMAASTATSRSCGTPSAGCRAVQCPVDRGEERLPEPRSSSSGVAHRDVTQARRMRHNLCPRNRVRYTY